MRTTPLDAIKEEQAINTNTARIYRCSGMTWLPNLLKKISFLYVNIKHKCSGITWLPNVLKKGLIFICKY
jgi:hypothetical protein